MGQFEFQNVVYSSSQRGVGRVRGLPDIDTEFAFVVFDTYMNASDTVKFWAKPFFEVMLNKKLFREAGLAGDNTTTWGSNRYLRLLFDGDYTSSATALWVSGTSPSAPQYFTIDLGTVIPVSRFVLFIRSDAPYYYNQFTPEKFKVYGTDELTHPANDVYFSDGSWKADWMDLTPEMENEGTEDQGIFVLKKPSGGAVGSALTEEDAAALEDGFEFTLETFDIPPVRYLRFEVIKTFSNSLAMEAREIDIFGGKSDDEGEEE